MRILFYLDFNFTDKYEHSVYKMGKHKITSRVAQRMLLHLPLTVSFTSVFANAMQVPQLSRLSQKVIGPFKLLEGIIKAFVTLDSL